MLCNLKRVGERSPVGRPRSQRLTIIRIMEHNCYEIPRNVTDYYRLNVRRRNYPKVFISSSFQDYKRKSNRSVMYSVISPRVARVLGTV